MIPFVRLAFVTITVIYFSPVVFGKVVLCDPTLLVDMGTPVHPLCSSSQPYCRFDSAAGTNLTSGFRCVECNSHCDCGLNDWCSVKPGQLGSCQSFNKDGQGCLPLNAAQITSANFSTSLKCAYTYKDTLGNLQIDMQGICVGGHCRLCDRFVNPPGLPSCSYGQGNGPDRACLPSGGFSRRHTYAWNPSLYYEFPQLVWWAVLFVIFLLIVVTQTTKLILDCVLGKTEKSQKPKKENIPLENRPTTPISEPIQTTEPVQQQQQTEDYYQNEEQTQQSDQRQSGSQQRLSQQQSDQRLSGQQRLSQQQSYH